MYKAQHFIYVPFLFLSCIIDHDVHLCNPLYLKIEYVRYRFSKVIEFGHLDIVFVKCDLHL